MAVRIGIPLGLDAGRRLRPPRHYHVLEVTYTRAVADAGAIPVPLARGAPPERLLDLVDGLLLPGGDDVPDPEVPGPDPRLDPVPPEQLAFDRALLRGARARGLPVLGICYGMQLLALEAGGRLHHHLPTDRPEAPPHRPEGDRPPLRHPVELEPGSRLAALLGARRLLVNSLHHQGVADPGALRPAARSPDGLLEAVEAPGHRLEIGVQWHPEKLGDEASRRLFRALVRAAAGSAPPPAERLPASPGPPPGEGPGDASSG